MTYDQWLEFPYQDVWFYCVECNKRVDEGKEGVCPECQEAKEGGGMTDRELLTSIYVDMALLKKEWRAFELVRELVLLAATGTVLDLGSGTYPMSSIVKRMRELVRGEE